MTASDPIAREEGLRRELTSGQLTMIALGGAIGTGLFLGSTLSIRIAGPAVIVSYLLGALIAFAMAQALGQMTARHPTAGSFGVHAELYLGSWASYVVKWSYWFAITISIGGEAIASGTYVQYWLPNLPLWIPVVVVSLALVAINAMHVGAFGTFEYWFAMIKVVAIVLFILFGIAILAGLRPAEVPGIEGYRPFAPSGTAAIWLALPVVMFSYLGTEFVAITAGEAKDPERAIPRAMRQTIVRLILFYVLAMALLLALMPWREISPAHSPFVKVFEIIGIPGAPAVMTAVVLTAALSSMNTNLYVTTRMLFSLARSGDAPARFGVLGRHGTPVAALVVSALGMAAASVASRLIPGESFVLFFGVSIFGGLFVWAMIFLTHIFYQMNQRDIAIEPGRPLTQYSPLRVLLSACGFLVMVAIIATTWWVPGLDITLKSGIPWLVLLTIAWKLTR